MQDLEKRFYFSPDGDRLNVSAGLAVPEGRFELGVIRTERKPTRFKLSHNVLLPSTASCRWKVALNCASNPDSSNS
jgi:hypothetical protein